MGMGVSKAMTGAPSQGAAVSEGASSSVGPGAVSTAWLGFSGRVGAGISCSWSLAAGVHACWRQQCTHGSIEAAGKARGGSQMGDRAAGCVAVTAGGGPPPLSLVAEQLGVQQRQSSAGAWTSAAAGCAAPEADAGALRKLQRQAVELFKQWQALQEACSAALTSRDSSTTSSSQAQLAAQRAFAAARGASGRVPGALQQLGKGRWYAFSHKYACSDPSCANLQALTEASAAKEACTDYKMARYCCQELQVCHWPQHKKACKAITGPGRQQWPAAIRLQ